jgi:spore germination protein YaaH
MFRIWHKILRFSAHKGNEIKVKTLLYCLFIIWFTWPVATFPQHTLSVHESDYRAHTRLPKAPSQFATDGRDIIAFQPEGTSGLSRNVFGYLPDWQYQSVRNYLQYDLLSHIAAFDFSVDVNGNLSNPSYWPWTDVINAAHSNGVKVILVAVNFSTSEIHTILTTSSVKEALFANIKSKIAAYKLDGVNIDFEGMSSSDRGALLNGFMSELTSYIHDNCPGSEVSFAGPAVNWGGWDLAGLSESCDYIFIMGYDFYGSWSTTSGPCAPLTGGSYNITNTVTSQYNWVTQNHPDRLILGVPYYGNRWKTASGSAYASVVSYIEHPRYSTAITEAQSYGLRWDAQSKTSWYAYSSGGAWYQAWFDTDSSLGMKYDLADDHNYRGVGMWALGYDGARLELWNELRRRYAPSTDLQESALSGAAPSSLQLYPNYPNPFNNATVIWYRTGAAGMALFQVFDLQGRIIFTQEADVAKGENRLTWRGERCDGRLAGSGTYFYRITLRYGLPGYAASGKMLLIK